MFERLFYIKNQTFFFDTIKLGITVSVVVVPVIFGISFLRPKKKLFGCPPLPAPNFEKLDKSFYCTKVYGS